MSLQEEVREILQANTTRATKAKKLKDLGITSYEVTIMLRDAPLRPIDTSSEQDAATSLPPSSAQSAATAERVNDDFDVNILTFGIEIECYGVARNTLLQNIESKNINIKSERYNHRDSRDYFKIVSDSSIQGTDGQELVSPVLRGSYGLECLHRLCEALSASKAKVNISTGMHVHFGLNGITDEHYVNIFNNYSKSSSAINKFLPRSRRFNRFCQTIGGIDFTGCKTKLDVEKKLKYSRYYTVNPQSYTRHKTIEFRQHSGTIEYRKIYHWIIFLRALISYSRTNRLTEYYNDPMALPYVQGNEELVRYIASREAELQKR